MPRANLNKNKAPYRPPCSGKWTGKYYVPRWNHYRKADSKIPVFTNISKLLNTECNPPQIMPLGEIVACGPDNTQSCASPCNGAGCNPVGMAPGSGIKFGNNYFQAAMTFISRAVCFKAGFKNVQAYKVWHGALPFNYVPAAGTPGQCACPPAYQPNAPSVRYLTATVSASYNANYPLVVVPDIITIVSNYNVTISIDRSTGNATLGGCLNKCVFTDDPNAGGLPPTVETYYADTGLSGLALPGSCPVNFSGQITYPNALWPGEICGVGVGSANPNYPATVSVSYGEAEYSYQFSQTVPAQGSTPGSTWTINVSVTLSNPYTAAENWADCASLLGEWDLTNDQIYPWRTDGGVTSAPLVTVDEKGPTSPLSYIGTVCCVDDGSKLCDYADDGCGGHCVAWTDPNARTGNVIGAPSPAGYAPYFDCAHINWSQGTDQDPYEWEVGSYGAFAPSWCPQATQWTDNFTATGLYGGAYWGMTGGVSFFPFSVLGGGSGGTNAAIYGGGCFMQKWAEIILFAPSHNFARPCGPVDRATYDLTTINCKSNPTGNLRWPNAPCNCDDPSNPGPAAPAPCPPNTPGVLNQWNDIGIKGDYVTRELTFNARDVGEYARMVAAIASWPATGCGDPPNPPANPGRGGSSLVGIELDQRCASYANCCPTVVCYSPNGEKFTNGVTIGMASAGSLDETYGTFWHAQPIQWMVDPLFQPPNSPDCNGKFWAADNGSCQPCSEDLPPTCYYFVPYEEARCTLPAGAPALPAGITLGATQNGDGTWSGPMSAVPQLGGDGYLTPWTYWLNQLATCCNLDEDCVTPS